MSSLDTENLTFTVEKLLKIILKVALRSKSLTKKAESKKKVLVGLSTFPPRIFTLKYLLPSLNNSTFNLLFN